MSAMSWNEEDDDFEFGGLDGQESDEGALEDIRQDDERIQNLPIMIMANQILETVEALIETLPEDDIANHYKRIMIEDALVLAPKIAGAESADLYTLRMENAVMVKMAARDLLTQTSGLKMMGLSEPGYLEVLRSEMEDFRELFVVWVKSFDKSKDIKDNWGLFYD